MRMHKHGGRCCAGNDHALTNKHRANIKHIGNFIHFVRFCKSDTKPFKRPTTVVSYERWAKAAENRTDVAFTGYCKTGGTLVCRNENRSPVIDYKGNEQRRDFVRTTKQARHFHPPVTNNSSSGGSNRSSSSGSERLACTFGCSNTHRQAIRTFV